MNSVFMFYDPPWYVFMVQESALAWYKKVYAWKEPQTKVCSTEFSSDDHFCLLPKNVSLLVD